MIYLFVQYTYYLMTYIPRLHSGGFILKMYIYVKWYERIFLVSRAAVIPTSGIMGLMMTVMMMIW